MTFYVEQETEQGLSCDVFTVGEQVIRAVLLAEHCEYETEITLLLTNNEGIRRYNQEYRGIDSATDVLSFPNVDYDAPADYSNVISFPSTYLNPDTDELVLGDIIISVEKVIEQAEQYGHSVLREFAFLMTHSMLHLLGYDHMQAEEAQSMEYKQEQILSTLGITRDHEE
ncbi:MAG: rRNA maturation RNase YbeY [Lachnospiraceae bacterium]